MNLRVSVIATGSGGNAYILNIGETAILLDAGVPLDKIKTGNKFRLSNIRAALITHNHKDHAAAVPELLENCIPLYIAPGVEIKEIKYKNSVYLASCAATHKLEKNLRILAVNQIHDVPCCGFDILIGEKNNPEIIVHYITDTIRICKTTNYIYPADAVHFYICECNYTVGRMAEVDDEESAEIVRRNQRTRETHLSNESVNEFFNANPADAVLFVHKSKLNFDDVEFKKTFTAAVPYLIAAAGRVYEFNTETKRFDILK